MNYRKTVTPIPPPGATQAGRAEDKPGGVPGLCGPVPGPPQQRQAGQ